MKALLILVILLLFVATLIAGKVDTDTSAQSEAISLERAYDTLSSKGKGARDAHSSSSSVKTIEERKKRRYSSRGGDKRDRYGRRGSSGDGPPRERKMRIENPMTLKVLAYKHRISVEELQGLNYSLRTLTPSDTIHVRRLRLPTLRIRRSYYVKQGDTWSTVAERLSVDEKKLRAVNVPFIEGELVAGQTLFPPDPPDLRWLWILLLGILFVLGTVVIMKLAIKDE